MKSIWHFILRLLGLEKVVVDDKKPLPSPPPVVIPDPMVEPPIPTPEPTPEPPVVDVGETVITVQGTGLAAILSGLSQVPNTGGRLVIDGGEHSIDGEISIENRENLTIDFRNNATLRFISDGSPTELKHAQQFMALRPIGTVRNLSILRPRIISAVNKGTAGQIGFGNWSGQSVRGLKIEDGEFIGINVAVAINAHLGGDFDDVTVARCKAKDILGKLSGQGYGFNVAGATNVLFIENEVDNAERHAYYCGWTHKDSVGNIRFIKNKAKNHRLNASDGGFRCAFVVSRSHNVLFEDNEVVGGRDGGFEISMVNTDPAPNANSNCYDITVRRHKFSGRMNLVPSMVIGEQSNLTDYRLERIKIEDCSFISDEALVDVFGPDIFLMNGFEIDIIRPNIIRLNGELHETYKRCITLGDVRYSPTRAQIDNIRVVDSSFALSGDSSLFRPITLGGWLKDPSANISAPPPLFFEG
jgi:hypothetical protein